MRILTFNVSESLIKWIKKFYPFAKIDGSIDFFQFDDLLRTNKYDKVIMNIETEDFNDSEREKTNEFFQEKGIKLDYYLPIRNTF